MDDRTAEREPIERLAEQYVERLRRGDQPTIEEFTRDFPALASQIRELFPLLEAIEGVHERDRTLTLGGAPSARMSGRLPECIGPFRIVREIGRGGMGVVYEAEQPALQRHVALKLLHGSTATSDCQQRLRAEALALARLDHAHIVPVFDVGDHEGLPYFTMPLVQGTNLSARLAEGPLHGRESAELLAPVCRAMAEAHRRGIVHRDLKPSNILLDSAGRPFVADFGLARSLDAAALSQTGTMAGTPSYMAPEQAVPRGPVGPATDIYGLGAVLYEMLTGRPPFEAASTIETIVMVLEEEPAPPRLLNSTVDPRLEAIAVKCLQKVPAARYASADDLANDLEAYLNDEPVSACKFRFSDLLSLAVRETRHAAVLERWGREWMFQGCFLFAMYALNAALKWRGHEDHGVYYLLWALCFPVWYIIIKWLHRWGGAVTLIERQIFQLSAASTIVCVTVLVFEGMLQLPALLLSPLFAIVGCAQFSTLR